LPEQSIAEIESLRQVLNRLLEERDRNIAELHEFTANVAHELRSPLTAMQGELEVELRSNPPPEPRRVLESTLAQTRRLIRIVRDLLYLTRLRESPVDGSGAEINREVFDVGQTLANAIATLTPQIEKKQLVLTSDLADRRVVLRGNELSFERLWINLLMNAIIHSPLGGTIGIVARDTDNAWICSISDDGPGIPPLLLEKVFQRLFTIDESRGTEGRGTGLGLPIARAIAQTHGATLRLESDGRTGTTCILEIPHASELVIRVQESS
jgi:signal transduction histidine kinase